MQPELSGALSPLITGLPSPAPALALITLTLSVSVLPLQPQNVLLSQGTVCTSSLASGTLLCAQDSQGEAQQLPVMLGKEVMPGANTDTHQHLK